MTFPVGSLTAFLSVKGAAQARQDILTVRQAMAETGGAADTAATGLDRVDVALQGTARASLNASTTANKLRAAQLDQVAAVERYNKVLLDENATLAQVARAEAALIRANERVTASTPVAGAFKGAAAGANEAAVATSRFSGAVASTIGMAKSLGLLFGAVEAVKKAIDITKEANDFQKNMLLIQTNANASAGEVKDMSAALLKLSPQVGTGPVELAQALYHVEQNGLRGKAALDAVTVGAQGAKIGLADVEDTTNTLTIALASGITGMGNMQQAMGTMIAIAGTGDMRLRDLNEAMSGGILSVAKGYGATLGDVAAVFATLGDNGIRGVDAATALRQTMMGFAEPAAKGAHALASVGLAMHDLRDDMEQHGLVHAMNDLEAHMTQAGVTGAKVGGFITEAFGKRAGAGLSVLMGEIDRLNIKFDEGAKGGAMFMTKWQQTTTTAAFAFDRLKAGFSAAGISLAEKLQPALADASTWLADELPKAIATVQSFLKPLEHEVGVLLPAAWGLFAGAAKLVYDVLHPVGQLLSDIKGPLTTIGVAALGAWAAFKGVEIVKDALVGLGIILKGAAINALDFGTATVAGARGFLGLGGAATTAATEVAAASTVIAVSADGVATVVEADAATAEVAWTAMLGPLAAVGVGIGLLVTMWGRSTGASKEATDAAKAYSDALKSSDPNAVQNSIVGQLTAANIPEKIATLNKLLGQSKFNAQSFVTAIQSGDPALKTLQARLQSVVDAGTTAAKSVTAGRNVVYVPEKISESAKIASKLLGDLKTQADALTKDQIKDLADTKAFAGVSSQIDQVAQSTSVGSKTALQYAQMLGFVFDKNGVTAASSKAVAAAIDEVTQAYNGATQSGDDFLSALNTFSQSAGTAADRAALIGATLKAANGDALNYVGAMAQATAAQDALGAAFEQQSQQLAQQSSDQNNAAKAVVAAQQRVNEVKANAKHTTSELTRAEDALTKAQQNAAKAGALTYSETEKAALSFSKAGKASIDYTKEGAAPLVQQLQAMQTAAMAAAQAVYQHEVAIKGGKAAADDAYHVYLTQTQGALVDQAEKLGITTKQAQALANEYFGMPSSVKTQIEAEGTDPILNVLTKIGKMLAIFTGQPWDAKVTVSDKASSVLDGILTRMGKIRGTAVVAHVSAIDDLNAQKAGGYTSGSTASQPTYGPAPHKSATGGYVSGPGTATSDSIPYKLSNGEFVMNAAATARLRPLLEAANRSKGTAPFGMQPAPVVKHMTWAPTIINPLPETVKESEALTMTRAANLLDRD